MRGRETNEKGGEGREGRGGEKWEGIGPPTFSNLPPPMKQSGSDMITIELPLALQ
jgi:hypothetical protein